MKKCFTYYGSIPFGLSTLQSVERLFAVYDRLCSLGHEMELFHNHKRSD